MYMLVRVNNLFLVLVLIFAGVLFAQDHLMNQDIVKMVQAGIGPDLILAKIKQAADVNFDISTDGLIALKEARVPESVISAMMERQSSSTDAQPGNEHDAPATPAPATPASPAAAMQTSPPPSKTSPTPVLPAAGIAPQPAAPAPATQPVRTPVSSNGRMAYVEVSEFAVQDGINFPEDYLRDLTDRLVFQLRQIKDLKGVYPQGMVPADLTEPVVKLNGRVIEYHPGSATKRFLFGMLAGTTKVVAHVEFVDSTGHVIFEDKVDGKVTAWSADQNSAGATDGLAKEVLKKTKKKFSMQ